jgi:hypothetical protein
VGLRFADDPRIAAEAWVRQHVARDRSIESDVYSSDWRDAVGPELRTTVGPFVTGRDRLFARIFPGDRFILGSDDDRRLAEEMVEWYSIPALTARDPDYVAMDSLYYGRFVEPGVRRDLYPEMFEFYDTLLTERARYRIVFDRRSTDLPWWIYPRDMDFTHHRVTILGRQPGLETH